MTMAPDYLVEVRDRDFVRRGQIAPEYLSIMFTEVFRGVGAWELKLPTEHPLLPVLKTKGSGIVVTESWTTELPQPPVYGAWTETRRNLANPASSLVLGSASITPGVSYDGTTWTQLNRGAGGGGIRHDVPLADLVNGETYRVAIELANPGATAVSVNLDWCDVGIATYTIQPGERRVIAGNKSRAAYDSVYRFFDVEPIADNTSVLYRMPFVERTTAAADPFDGDSAGDTDVHRSEWAGTPGASQSIVQVRTRTEVPPVLEPHSRTYSGRTNSCKLDQDAEDPKGTWTVAGYDDGIIAKATVVYPDPLSTATAQTKAYWNLVGNGETVMKQAVRLNAGDLAFGSRPYPWLVVPTNLNRGGQASANARFDVLGDLLQALGAQSGLGWTFHQVGAQVVFDVTEPTDRTAFVRLDVATGGLESSELAFSSPTATRVLVLGQGEGADRTVRYVNNAATVAEENEWGLRWETTKDQRNTDDPDELLDAGNEILNEQGATIRSLKVTPSDAPGQKLGRDWGLGDTVTVVIDGEEAQAVVTQLATSIGPEGVIKQATVGDPVGYDWEAKVSSKLGNQGKRIDRLENYIDTASPDRLALLDASYRGPGPAKVRFLDDPTATLTTEAYYWAVPYVPWGSRVVKVSNVKGTWLIAGQDGGQLDTARSVRLTWGTGWNTYNKTVGEHNWADGPIATRLSSGLVVLSGLLRFPSGTPALHSIVASGLPADMRPEEEVLLYLNNGDTAKAISIRADGTIRARAGWASSTYISLDGLAYWPAGVGTWTPIGQGGSSWGPNFEDNGVPAHGVASFWKDPYGFTWYKGIAKIKVATSADNTLMLTLPADHRAAHYQHMRTAGNEGFADVASDPASGLKWKGGSPTTVGSWISLFGMVSTTADALANNPWENIDYYANSWANYVGSGTSFPMPAFVRRGDGLCLTKGLIGGGTLGAVRAFELPREMWPSRGRMIVDTVMADARGRIDISGMDEIETPRLKGGVAIINGSSAWASLDSVKWTPVI